MKGQIISALILGGLLIIFLGALFAPANSSCQSWNCLKYIPDNIVDFENNMPTYGEIYICGDIAQSIVDLTVGDTWYNVTDNWNYGENLNVGNITAHDLNFQKTGVYSIDYSVSFSGSAKRDMRIAITENGLVCNGCTGRLSVAVGGAAGNVAGTCIYTVNDTNMAVKMQMLSVGGANTITIDDASLKVTRLGDIP